MPDIVVGSHVFDEANNTEVNGLAVDVGGGAFVVPSGNNQVLVKTGGLSGGAQNTAYSGQRKGWVETPISQTVEYTSLVFNNTPGGTSWAGASLGLTSADTASSLLGYTAWVYSATTIELRRNGTVVASVGSLTIAAGDEIRLEVDYTNYPTSVDLAAYLNGVLKASYTDSSPIAQGWPAFHLQNGQVQSFAYGYVAAATTLAPTTPAPTTLASNPTFVRTRPQFMRLP